MIGKSRLSIPLGSIVIETPGLDPSASGHDGRRGMLVIVLLAQNFD